MFRYSTATLVGGSEYWSPAICIGHQLLTLLLLGGAFNIGKRTASRPLATLDCVGSILSDTVMERPALCNYRKLCEKPNGAWAEGVLPVTHCLLRILACSLLDNPDCLRGSYRRIAFYCLWLSDVFRSRPLRISLSLQQSL